MTLSPGTRFGPYEITASLGAGGMGEVYKAHDARLDRSVAIKILPPDVSTDAERRARFEREAKTIAGLNHPHICTLHDVGECGGMTYLVMEHLTGETLAQRLERGPLPLDEALRVATEIAEALAAAHRQGVIHRDLKPGNVMLTKTGAKLLDFGLAKLKAHGEQAAAHLESAPTQATPLTGEGKIVGTLQYMAPEQVEGKEADARTDLWALGAILYEMVTGRCAFEGASSASLIANIMKGEPQPLASRQPLAPPTVDRLVKRCLAKSPDDRPDTAHDLAEELRFLHEAGGAATPSGTLPRLRPGVRMALTITGGLLLIVIGAGLMWLLRPASPRMSLTHPSLDVLPADEISSAETLDPTAVTTPGGSRTALVWTSDGQAIIFVGRQGGVQRLYVRRLDGAEARPLDNTEGAQAPAVSPDGQWVAFWAGGAIRKVPVGGGPVMDLASGVPIPPWGLSWDASGRLFLGRGYGGSVWMIPAEGSPSAATTVRDGEVAHILPWPLPDGKTLLYTVRKRQWSWGDEEVVAQTLGTGARKVLLKDGADARYVASGHLVFLRRGVLFAVPFDAERLEIQGTPIAVLNTVAQALTAGNTDYVTGAGQFAVAATGSLAWVPGPVVPYPDATLVMVDRHGQISPLPAPIRSYASAARVSPDGRRLAVLIRTLTDSGVWLYDMARGTTTVLAKGGEAWIPIWSPDGRRLAFELLADGRQALAVQPADGTSQPQVLLQGDLTVSSFTPDGRSVAVVRNSRDVVIVRVDSPQPSAPPPTPSTQYSERWPEFSPDGRSLAYGSDVSGRFEVFVRPYPGPGPAEQVSVEGGWSPAWHPNGRELFFVSLPDGEGRRRLMSAEFAPGSPPHIGLPRELFTFDPRQLRLACNPVRCYDVTADGQRFFATQTPAPPLRPQVTHISLILNWFDELKAKVALGR